MTAQDLRHPGRPQPFHDVLRAAITARKLPLARIHAKLVAAGTPVSMASLSHWQSGRSLPSQRRSQMALLTLEQVLDLAPGSLTSLVGSPRPRGRRSGEAVDFAEVFKRDRLVAEALDRFDYSWGADLTALSSHDVVRVGPDGRVRDIWNRRVMRATADGPDRAMVLCHSEVGATPRIHALRGCTLGRVYSDPRTPGVTIAELLTGRPLRHGESLITEHRIEFAAPYALEHVWERRFDRPVREYVLEVDFAGPLLPARCIRYCVSDVPGGRPAERVVELDGFARASAVALDFGPGRYGMRWVWDEPSGAL